MSARRVAPLVLLAASCASAAPGEEEAVAVVETFRVARAAGRIEEARALLADDPRVWYDRREGEGAPWKLTGGRWSDWDEHFRGRTIRVGEWSVRGRTVSADMFEINDWFRLLEGGGGWWRASYFLDEAGRIEGFLVGPAEGRAQPRRARRDEFEAWAFAARPEEAEHLMPGGSLDPTGDRAPRMRALLEEWRAAVGLDPLDP